MNTRRKGDIMKAQRWLLLTAVILLLAGSAIAQNGSTRKVSANVPFDFVVNDTTLPKGEYVVSTPIPMALGSSSKARRSPSIRPIS